MTYRDNIKAILEANFIGSREEYLDRVCSKICEIPLTDKSYQDGLSDAWECARKIILCQSKGGFSADAYTKIFGYDLTTYEVLKNYTASEALTKIKEYEEKENEIKLWDEVIIKKSSYGYAGHKGIVVDVQCTDEVQVLLKPGVTYYYDTAKIKRTGKSYPELANILNQLKEIDEK